MTCPDARPLRAARRSSFVAVLLCFVLLALSPLRTAAGDVDEGIVVLLNARNPTQAISSADLAKLFLGQTVFWHGVVPVRALLRPDGSLAAKTFCDTALHMSPQAFRKHWDEIQLSGRAVAPKVLATADEVAQAVAQAPGGIGYALSSEAWKLNNKGVKVIQVR
jgi:ABC-type phosphate transport system substrate-binding protein